MPIHTEECFDYRDDCATWATYHNCRYKKEEALGCQKSCKKCVSKDKCKDNISNCHEHLDQCDSPYAGNQQWVKNKCAKTCGVCSTKLKSPIATTKPTKSCYDDELYCKNFSDKEFRWWCKSHVELKHKCKKSCGTCTGECDDKLMSSKCQKAKKQGKCSQDYYKENCIETCGIECPKVYDCRFKGDNACDDKNNHAGMFYLSKCILTSL